MVQSRRQRWQELQGRLCCRRSLHRLRRQWIFAFTHTDRDVDCWGGSLEAKFWGRDPVQVRPNLLRTDYLLIGADIRGIDQNNDLNGSWSARTVFKYNEDLNTTYYGGYISFGGEYSLGFLGTGGLWESLGLRSYLSARAGLYDAATDYDGKFAFQFIPVSVEGRSRLYRQRLVRDPQTVWSAHEPVAVERL